MIGLLLIAAAGATAVLVALSLRLRYLVSTLLVAYLALVANFGLVTLALSPARWVTRPGLAVAEGVLLAGSTLLWRRRGMPGLPQVDLRLVAAALRSSPVTLAFLALVGVVLGYELVQALTVPPNNWDSLTYHLPRAASWAQHHGIYRIPDAATSRVNDYQPLAEQQLLFVFVATGNDALFALPQYLAELAILVAVYGSARRLGYGLRESLCASCLLACFSLVALQAPTAQNDLVAASFPAVAACLILGGTQIELLVAGAAVGLGVGAKLTTALVLPVLVWLAALRGRRALALGAAGAATAFFVVGMWGFVLNLANTGRVLGELGTYVERTSVPLRPGMISTGLGVLYETFDLAVLSDRTIVLLAIAGVVTAAAAGAYAVVRRGARDGLATGAGVAVPFLAPLILIGAGGIVAWIARAYGSPLRGHLGNVGELNRAVGGAVFGPVGAVVFLGVPLLTFVSYLRRRVDARHLALAAAVPCFYLLVSFATFNYFLTRFLLVPAVLTAPLFARLFRGGAETAAYVAVAGLVLVLVVARNPDRPLDGRFGRPWNLTQVQAAALSDQPTVAAALTEYRRVVPRRACVGAVLGSEEPAYLLWGRGLDHRVVYLSVGNALADAFASRIYYAVISTGTNGWAAGSFAKAGWTVRPLGDYWQLAVSPGAGDDPC